MVFTAWVRHLYESAAYHVFLRLRFLVDPMTRVCKDSEPLGSESEFLSLEGVPLFRRRWGVDSNTVLECVYIWQSVVVYVTFGTWLVAKML